MKLEETSFYAAAEGAALQPGREWRGRLLSQERKYAASIRVTPMISGRSEQPYLLVTARLPEPPAWNEYFRFQPAGSSETLGLRVIGPEAGRVKKAREEKLAAWLDRLSGSKEEMLLGSGG